jgi:hypothetical protein
MDYLFQGKQTHYISHVLDHQVSFIIRKSCYYPCQTSTNIFLASIISKKNKKLYFEQMGEWFTNEKSCNGLDCCLKEPNVTCHYRDKPSSVYCGMVDPIDKGRSSFWKSDEEIKTMLEKNKT